MKFLNLHAFFLAVFGMLALKAFAQPLQAQVQFGYDSTRVSEIRAGGFTTLGPRVGTGGGYWIGSPNGSDAQGLSVISIGGTNGFMVSDNPTLVPPPRFSLAYSQSGNTLTVTGSAGPMPIDFAAMSFPIDFSTRAIESFRFNGTRYRWQCTGQDGWRSGSGATFDSIPQGCQIRNQQGVLLGLVGAAITDGPVSWAEVTGSVATVRVNILSHSLLRNVEFDNHFGTHNLALSFGPILRGQTARFTIQIVVTPKSEPKLFYESETDFQHQIGRRDGAAWSVNVTDPINRYLAFGPYTRELNGNRAASFRLLVDNVTAAATDRIVKIEVFEFDTGRVLASRDIRRGDFTRAFTYQPFELPFRAEPGRIYEFRTFYRGGSYCRQDRVVVR